MAKKLDLSKCPILKIPVWDEEAVLVARDWAIEYGHVEAERWVNDDWTLVYSPRLIRAALAGNVDPAMLAQPVRDTIEHFGGEIDAEAAQNVFGLMTGTVDPLEFASVKKWVAQTYNRPRRNELVMEALNEVLEGHGVEAIRIEGAWVDNFHHDIVATYVNMGDTYAATVVYDTEHSRFELSTYGDFVEARERAQQEAPLIHNWNIGYDLDGGGYSFEHAAPRVSGAVAEANGARDISTYVVLQWDQPDLDYVTGGDVVPGGRRRRPWPDLLLIVPGAGEAEEWPHVIPEDDDTELHLLVDGVLFETDHDCMWCGAGTGTEPSPDPNCQRCEGDGYVVSPGGAYGIYERREVEEEEPRYVGIRETEHYE